MCCQTPYTKLRQLCCRHLKCPPNQTQQLKANIDGDTEPLKDANSKPVNKALVPGGAALATTKPAAADLPPKIVTTKPAVNIFSLPSARKSMPAGVAASPHIGAMTTQVPNSADRHLEMARKIKLFMGAEMQPQVCPQVSCLWWFVSI